jgi:hypothetical protein
MIRLPAGNIAAFWVAKDDIGPERWELGRAEKASAARKPVKAQWFRKQFNGSFKFDEKWRSTLVRQSLLVWDVKLAMESDGPMYTLDRQLRAHITAAFTASRRQRAAAAAERKRARQLDSDGEASGPDNDSDESISDSDDSGDQDVDGADEEGDARMPAAGAGPAGAGSGTGSDAKAAVPLALFADAVVTKTEKTIEYLGDFNLDIADSDAQRLKFYKDRAQFLAAIRDNLLARLPKVERFEMFGKLFDPKQLPATVAMGLAENYGQDAVNYFARLYGRRSASEPGLDPLGLEKNWPMVRSKLINARDKLSGKPTAAALLRFLLTAEIHSDLRDTAPDWAWLAEAALTQAVVTVDPERGFSRMNLIKTDRRTRLLTPRLSDLMLVSIAARPADCVDWEAVLNIWMSQCKRLVQLA